MNSIDIMELNGSFWRFRNCKSPNVEIIEYQPFRGNSNIKTQKDVLTGSVIKVKNEDKRWYM